MRHLEPVQVGIVANDRAPIGAQADIEFKAIAAIAQGLVEGGKGVLRRAAAAAAMAEQQGSAQAAGVMPA